MKLNIFIEVTYSLITIAQMFIPIAYDRTLFSYFVYFLVIPARLIFFCKIWGIQVDWKISPAIEWGAYVLTMIFMFAAKWKKSFPIVWWGFALSLVLHVIVFVGYVLENTELVYTERELPDE